MLRDQLQAVATVAADGDAEIWAMAPMVSTAGEARWFAASARAAGIAQAGVMVEAPSAALAAAAVLAEEAFASIGTNDLPRYVCSTDWCVRALADMHDPWHPALLQLVEMTAAAGAASARPVGVYGEAAGDSEFALVLVGLGISLPSMAAGSPPAVCERLDWVTLAGCQRLAVASDGSAGADSAVVEAVGH